jgi:hypothetical protein
MVVRYLVLYYQFMPHVPVYRDMCHPIFVDGCEIGSAGPVSCCGARKSSPCTRTQCSAPVASWRQNAVVIQPYAPAARVRSGEAAEAGSGTASESAVREMQLGDRGFTVGRSCHEVTASAEIAQYC